MKHIGFLLSLNLRQGDGDAHGIRFTGVTEGA
jgi:hypothetical protein